MDIFKKEKQSFLGFGSPNNVNDIVKQSSAAVCGLTEREVIAPKGKSQEYMRKLKAAGFMIIGTSLSEPKKIWFIRRGVAL